MNRLTSQSLFERASKVIPGGVNSPVRAFKSVGGNPLFVRRAYGSHVVDVDGNDFVEFVGSWGPMILGHAHPRVVEAAQEAVTNGTSYGAPTELEVLLAEKIAAAVPSVDVVRLVSSGTEAVMSALRVARGFTRREKIIKFEGCYHGHSDGLLAKAGSGLATLGIPDSPGVPTAYAALTITLPYNDPDAVRAMMAEEGQEIAAIIVEPVAGNMGVVPPQPGFLECLRAETQRHGALLIFDEVISGFRVAYGGAQQRFGVLPDMTVLGKIVGGGFPLAAYGARREIMEQVAPAGPIYQAGTLSGNPVAVSAGLATLEELAQPGVYERLETLGERLGEGLRRAAHDAGQTATLNRVASMMTTFFSAGPVTDWESASASDREKYGAFFRGMLERGFYFAPSQFEAAFVSTAHTEAEIDATIAAAAEVLTQL